jgi:hypothetical protein
MAALCDVPKTGSGSGVTPRVRRRRRSRPWRIRSSGPRAALHVARGRHAADQEQIDRRLTKNFDKSYPVDFYDRRSQAWGTIGVIPAGRASATRCSPFQTGQVVGFYNPANEQLVYIGDTDLDQTERFILAHELTHAIDDQHFGLDGWTRSAHAATTRRSRPGWARSREARSTSRRRCSCASRPTRRSAGAVTAVRSTTCRRSSPTLELWPYDAGIAFIRTWTRRAEPRRWTTR